MHGMNCNNQKAPSSVPHWPRSMGSPVNGLLPVPLEIVELLLILMNMVSFALVALVSTPDTMEKIPQSKAPRQEQVRRLTAGSSPQFDTESGW